MTRKVEQGESEQRRERSDSKVRSRP
jgi:hypothetical protein